MATPKPEQQKGPTMTGGGSSQTVLPGQQPRPTEGHQTPHTTQVNPKPGVPAGWADAKRIADDMLELFFVDPEEARRLHAFAKEKLAKIRDGK